MRRILDRGQLTFFFFRQLLIYGLWLTYSEGQLSATEQERLSPPIQELTPELYRLVYRGSQAFDNASYEQSIDCYQQAISALQMAQSDMSQEMDHWAKELSYRLALSHMAMGHYHDVITTLSLPPHLSSCSSQMLLAEAYLTVGQPTAAIDNLKKAMEATDVPKETGLLLAQAYSLQGDQAAAIRELNTFNLQNTNSSLELSTKLLKAHILLANDDIAQALHLLQLTQKSVGNYSMHYHELHCLMGEAWRRQGNLSTAICHYSNALLSQFPSQCPWLLHATTKLAECHVALAEKKDCTDSSREAHINQALTHLDSLSVNLKSEHTELLLARCCILAGQRLGQIHRLHQACQLLNCSKIISTPEGKSMALLLRAEASPSYMERRTLYRQLTGCAHEGQSYYGRAWYMRGLNDYKQAQLTIANNEEEREQKQIELLTDAVHCLSQAVLLLDPIDKDLSANALTTALTAYTQIASEHAAVEALALIENLQHRNDRLAVQKNLSEETLYLEAVLTRQSGATESNCERLLQQFLLIYPHGAYATKARFLLATTLFDQERFLEAASAFLAIHEIFPHDELAGDALYWQARCLQAIDKKREAVPLLERVYREYPANTYASEAYFHRYPITDYLTGNSVAIAHLRNLPKRFPQSPFVVNSYFLLGMQLKRPTRDPITFDLSDPDFFEAIDAFHQAETAYNRLYSPEQKITPQQITAATLRYRAALERAQTHLLVAEESEGPKQLIYIQYAIDLLERMVAELQDQRNKIAVLALAESSAPILDEYQYVLAQAHYRSGQLELAQMAVNRVLERSSAKHTTRGYYLSKAHSLSATLAMKRGDTATALACLSEAESAGQGPVLSVNNRLGLWIERSNCYRKQGHLDQAMRELSRVINADVISPQRVRAMYLRAEIYELLERPRLAQKQLKALAIKGGRWADKARERLMKEYLQEP